MAPESSNRWELNTWPELRRLAAEVPESGIHFQSELIGIFEAQL
jgi:D-amino-acid oxidase